VSAPTTRQRAGRIALRLGVAALALVGLLLIVLLIQATNNQRLYERYYAPLYAVNLALAAALALVIAWGIYRLVRRLRSGKFGSRLLVKFAAVFGLVGIMPGLLIYGVSFQFVSRSIESWFDVRVEGALNSGVNLARTSLEAQAREFGNQLRAAASTLTETPDATAGVPLERLRQQLGASDMMLWSASGRLIASAGASRFALNPDRPSAQTLRNVRQSGVVTQLEGLDEAADAGMPAAAPRVKALALVGGRGLSLLDEQRVLQAVQPLPADLVANALAVQQANREYQERALGRVGLRRMYIGTLTLSLALAVFGAVLLAVMLGKQIATPLLTLADGVRQVAAGDLTPKTVLPGRDEIVSLTRSFADMTQQLADARAALDASMGETEAARANLQTILDNLTAGVIVLEPGGRIVSVNPGATRILRVPLAASLGQELGSLARIESFAQGVAEQFAEFEGTRAERGLDHWQRTFELYGSHDANAGSGSASLTLVARGALLPDGRRLLVFDDISEVVSAQRARAWGEVARRLAHEIKNPLTPIQLSAERLERKLAGKLTEGAERAVLAKSVKTIIEQVDAMKRLVNEFRDYARLPAADLKPLDLNALVEDVLHLYGHGHDGHLEEGSPATSPVHAELACGCPQVLADAAQLRQVIHNLVQNALDASAPADAEQPQPPVTVRTEWHAATGRVRLSVLDQGHGFPEEILARAFEPYVTTKAKGTGLGLPVVKKIAEDHGARLDISNRVQNGRIVGARVSLSFDPAKPLAATISNV